MSLSGLWVTSGGSNGGSRGSRRGGAKGIALGGMARAQGASRGGARGGGDPCPTRGGGKATRESKSLVVELARVRNRGGGWRCASWRKVYTPAREGVGAGGVKGAYQRINQRLEWPVGEETGGGAAPPELRQGWRLEMEWRT